MLRHALELVVFMDLPVVDESFVNESPASRALEKVHTASKAVETSFNFMAYFETSV